MINSSHSAVELFRILARSFLETPESLLPVITTIVREDRPAYLAAALEAGLLENRCRFQLGLAALPLLDSPQPASVLTALEWIKQAGCDNPELLTRALMTARNHHAELIAMGADPNMVTSKAQYTAIGARFLAGDLTQFAQMIDSGSPGLPMITRTRTVFDLAFEDLTPARAEMIEYLLDRTPEQSAATQDALAVAVVRFATQRRATPPKSTHRETLATLLRMISRAGDITQLHPTAWHALFSSELAIPRVGSDPRLSFPAEAKFLRTVIDLASESAVCSLVRKAVQEGFSINHACIPYQGRALPALHYAVVCNRPELVSLFIRAGAQPHALDSRGASARAHAEQVGQEVTTALDS